MISIRTRGLQEFKRYIDKIARGARGVVTEAISKYLVGDPSHGLRHYYMYRHVTRARAYGMQRGGMGWFSVRQRQYVMSKIRSGEISPGSPHRTQKMRWGWKVEGKGTAAKIVNAVPYTKYVMGTDEQARQPALVGWRKVADIISTNIKGAIRVAEKAIRDIGR